MALKASEISELLKQRIEKFKTAAEARNEGTITAVSDGIVRIHGLGDVMYGEMIELPGNTFALALNLERDSVGAVVLGDYEAHLREGDTVKTTGRILEVPVGEGLLGRVVDALGNPIDGKGPIKAAGTSPIEKVAPGVIWRKSVNQPVQTGLQVGRRHGPDRPRPARADHRRPPDRQDRGGDRRHHQPEGSGIKCVYVAIGQKNSTRSPTWCASSKNMARWPTPSWSPRRPPNRPPCSTSRRTPAARWASTSAIAAKTR
jgi:F-type H+-transporting ATPase subunit alpha